MSTNDVADVVAKVPRRAGRRTSLYRCLDLTMAAVALVVLSPLIAVVALAVRIQIGSPVIFRQTRAGVLGRSFTIFKFRTMRDDRDAAGELLPDEARLTRFGRFLRSSSLDELPELFNVLRGDMSLVGPRPLRLHYLPLYSEDQARRHDVRPGITGLAQVRGRNALTWEEKFELDVFYVDHQSFRLDLKILFLTIVQIFKWSETAAEGHATTPEFAGTNRETVLDG